jgi:hypothetical protein
LQALERAALGERAHEGPQRAQIVELAEQVLQLAQRAHGLLRELDAALQRLEQVAQTLRGDARLVHGLLVVATAHTAQLGLEHLDGRRDLAAAAVREALFGGGRGGVAGAEADQRLAQLLP